MTNVKLNAKQKHFKTSSSSLESKKREQVEGESGDDLQQPDSRFIRSPLGFTQRTGQYQD